MTLEEDWQDWIGSYRRATKGNGRDRIGRSGKAGMGWG